jgi:voltage-gated potassium channel
VTGIRCAGTLFAVQQIPEHAADGRSTPRARRRIDRHWLRATAFTMTLVGLVAAAMGGEWTFAISAIVLSAVGFGFFYLMFPGGSHFGVTLANLLALYVCLFVDFRDANFFDAPIAWSMAALAFPLAAFLGGCFMRRRLISAVIHARRRQELRHLPRLGRWLPGMTLIGLLSFLLPRLNLSPSAQGEWLVIFMAGIALIVATSVRDLVLLVLDVAIVFESVAARLDRLVMPMMAFLTYYSLIVVVFACLYRIAQMSLGGRQFFVHGVPSTLEFGDALYFSVITVATVGYGDITPEGPLVRGLAAVEVLLGLLLLLFGFAEIMRSHGPDTEGRMPRREEPRRGEGAAKADHGHP